jgi:hypothetical protein
LGITLIRNQIVEEIPRPIKINLERADFGRRLFNLRKNKPIVAFIFYFPIKIIVFLEFHNKDQNSIKKAILYWIALAFFS